MPPRGGGAAGGQGPEDDDQHHLIERSEEGRARQMHLQNNQDREAEELWQRQANRCGEGSLMRRALKVLMAGTFLLLLLSLVHENWGRNDRSDSSNSGIMTFSQDREDAPTATATAVAAAATREQELKELLDAETARRHKAEAETAAAKQELERLKKQAGAETTRATEKKEADEDEATAVAAAVTAAKKKKKEKEEEEKKEVMMTVAGAAEGKGEQKGTPDEDEAAALAAAVASAKKRKKEEDAKKKETTTTTEAETPTAVAEEEESEEDEEEEKEQLEDPLAEGDDELEEEEEFDEDEDEDEEKEEKPASTKAKASSTTDVVGAVGKKPAKGKPPSEPSTSVMLKPPATTAIPAFDLSTLDTAAEVTKLTTARSLIATSLQALEKEHGPDHAKVLFASVHFFNRDYIKHKLVRALLGRNASPGKAQSGHDFILSFAGTSVTAGHDNFFQQSYPIVMQKLLMEAYTSAGLNLTIRNHAMGNNPAIPAAFCVKSQLGDDTDVAAWEFGMMVNGPLKDAFVEEWMRNALHLPKRPALLMIDPGEGARKPNSMGVLPTTPRVGPPSPWNIGDDKGSLLEHYAEFGVHTQAMYEAVWTLDHLKQYNFKALVQDHKPTPQPAGWHPGPGGHLLRAQILAHHYLSLLDDAIVDVQAALVGAKGVTATKLQTLLQSTEPAAPAASAAVGAADTSTVADKALSPSKTKTDLPAPLYCDPLFCGAAASCAMTYEPKQQDSLLDLIVSPAGLGKAKYSIDPQDSKKWHVQLFEADHEGVQFSRGHGFNYLDMKYVLQGNKDAGALTLAVETQSKQHLLFCQPPGVWGRMPEMCGDLRTDAAFEVDGQLMRLETATNFYFQHALESPTCWATMEQVEAGPHVITILPSNAEGKYIVLSALIWY